MSKLTSGQPVQDNTGLLQGFVQVLLARLPNVEFDLQGFCFFSVLHCIFDSNVKRHVSMNSSSVFLGLFIFLVLYILTCMQLIACAHCLPNLNKLICKCFPHYHLMSLSPKHAKIGHIYRSITC